MMTKILIWRLDPRRHWATIETRREDSKNIRAKVKHTIHTRRRMQQKHRRKERDKRRGWNSRMEDQDPDPEHLGWGTDSQGRRRGPRSTDQAQVKREESEETLSSCFSSFLINKWSLNLERGEKLCSSVPQLHLCNTHAETETMYQLKHSSAVSGPQLEEQWMLGKGYVRHVFYNTTRHHICQTSLQSNNLMMTELTGD